MKKSVVVFTLLTLVALSLFVWWKNGAAAVNTRSHEQKLFVIARGATVREIGKNLKDEGLIRDPIVFFLYIKKQGSDKSIQAGDYRLSPAMDLRKLVDTLNHGTLDVWVTVPEGYRADEIADLLKKNVKTYKDSWREELNNNEGFLFPDTYLIPTDASIETIITIMKNNFYKKIEELGIKENDPSLKETVIVASIVEREAKNAEDKAGVASVLYNRLRIGMPLQVDASVQYVLGKDGAWWKNPTSQDLKVDSTYNTYLNPGLTPGPISNPGLEALKVSYNPPKTSYLYYVSDDKGRLHFANTLDSHNKNINKYLNN